MADDTAETFMKDVQTLLNRNQGVTVSYGIKATSRSENADFPRVEWAYDDGRIEPTEKTGDSTGAFYTDVQPLIARCWGADRAACRQLRNNLILACREAARGPNFTPKRYRWLTENPEGDGLENGGVMLDVWLELKLPVLSEPTAFPTRIATVTSQRHTDNLQNPNTGHQTPLV